MNIKADLENMDLSQLKDLLKDLKLLKNLEKQLWKRWKNLFNKIKNWENTYEVEYFPVLGKDLAFIEAQKVYKNAFGLDVVEEEITFTAKDTLKWWIRVFLDDKIIDLSYDKIEKLLK